MIVLWTYPCTLFVLPCFTWSGQGFCEHEPSARRHNVYLWDRDNGKKEPPKTSDWNDLIVERNATPTDSPLSCDLTRGYTVLLREEIQVVGYLTKASTEALFRMWEKLAGYAKEDSWDNGRR